MESDLCGMLQKNIDLGVFQETKVTEGIYTRDSSGYKVVALVAPVPHSGGVAVFYHASEHFFMEALQIYGANSVSFQLASGGQTWFMVGCYLYPDNKYTIEGAVSAISQRPWGATLLVVGNFNTDLAAPE